MRDIIASINLTDQELAVIKRFMYARRFTLRKQAEKSNEPTFHQCGSLVSLALRLHTYVLLHLHLPANRISSTSQILYRVKA